MSDDVHRDSTLDRLGRDARVDARMLPDDTKINDAQRAAVIAELKNYRDTHLVEGRPVSWAKLASHIGVAPSVLSQTVNGNYPGDVDAILRKIDQFLAGEATADKRVDIRGFQRIKITEDIVAAISQTLVRRSIGVITGEPGTGKSAHARWLRDTRDGAILITCDPDDSDSKFVIDAIHKELRLPFAKFRRDKKRQIEQYLQTHTNTVIIVDESQFLTNAALETLRSFHDKSDIDGRRNVPIVLFGDDKFYDLVLQSRAGTKDRTPFSPQITSRMFPVLSVEIQCTDLDDDGKPIAGTVYTKEDIEKIVRSGRLRLARPDAIDFATLLANLHGWGRLRLAARVLEIAIDANKGNPVGRADLEGALSLFMGLSDARLIMAEIKETRASRKVAVG